MFTQKLHIVGDIFVWNPNSFVSVVKHAKFWNHTTTSSGRKKGRETGEKNDVNSGHYAPLATPKGSASTSLG